MQTFQQLATELNLTPEQKTSIEKYFNLLIVELLESIKQDNIVNFDETITLINGQSNT